MQVTKGTWRMSKQCVPGCLSSSPAWEPGNEARCHYDTWCWVQSLTLFNLCLLMLGFRLHWLIVTHKNCYSTCTLPHVKLFFPLPWETGCFPLQLCHLHVCACVTLKLNPCRVSNDCMCSSSYFSLQGKVDPIICCCDPTYLRCPTSHSFYSCSNCA